ncbi:MAG: TRAP transporter large permease [Rhodospirillaceae bacterium]|nr:TRAP transporter large permease [Rhodospirillaceae bacterium]
MNWYEALVLMLGAFMVLLALGLPVVFAFFTVNIGGALLFMGGQAGLQQLIRNAYDAVTNISLAPIPLFILMGEIMYHTGLAGRAIEAVDRLISRVPGRLSLVAIVSGTIFSALSGSTIANTAMLGSTLVPEMYRRGYHPHMAMGPILGTGGIAMLIPPSALGVLLASLGGIPVADLLVATIVPGVVMAGLFFGYVVLRCLINPALAPAYDVGRMSLWQRLRPFLFQVVPLLLIFVVVVGSIFAGMASPNEAAALGCTASVIAAACYRCLTLRGLSRALIETAKLSVMILFIICASITFSQILSLSNATEGLMQVLDVKTLSPVALILAMMVILLVLGCFMDQVSMMLITLPFFMPIVKAVGIEPVWFGVMMMIALEIGFTTPPFGLLLYVMKGVAPEGTRMRDIMAAAAPFIALMLLTLLMVLAIPSMALWLPSLISR